MVFKRGRKWWFKFRYQGQVIRESAKTTSTITIARDVERKKRRELERSFSGLLKMNAHLFSRWLQKNGSIPRLRSPR
jgi:hypothetical protein